MLIKNHCCPVKKLVSPDNSDKKNNSLKQYKLLLFFIVTLLTRVCGAQTYRLIDVNTTNFPVVEAQIEALDVNFDAEDFKIDSISIYENDRNINPISSKAPSVNTKAIPLSVVFALDVSSSMHGLRLNILKASAKRIIKEIPLEISEVAIASFNTHITLNCDFTHNETTLMNCIDSLWGQGGTSFEAAFFTKNTGLIDIAKQGQSSNKLIIFISDGMALVNDKDVAALANSNSIVINCITIDQPISNQLKTISRETNGNFYSDLSSEKEIDWAFKEIYKKSQGNSYGKIRWNSRYSCHPDKTTQLTVGQQTFSIQYLIPDEKVGSIELFPTEVDFTNDQQTDVVYKPVFIKGKHVNLNITSIENTNPAFFGIKPGILPIASNANELNTIELSFTPKDSIGATAKYTIKSEGCPDVYVNASSQGHEKLVITNPVGGEEFVKGEKVPVTWTGISNSKPVDLFYQIKGNENWLSIGSGTKYKKAWNAISLNDSIRIKGVVSGDITFANDLTSAVSIVDGSSFQSAYYNKNGYEILSLSEDGKLKSWDANSGKLKHTFEDVIKGDYAHMPGFNRVIDVTSKNIKVYTNRNGLLMKDIPLSERKNLTSLTHINNKELYVTLSNFHYLTHSQDSKYIDVTSSPETNYSIARDKSKLHVFKGNSKKEFSIKTDPTFQKSVLHRTKAILAVANANSTQLYNLRTKSLELNLEGECFHKFSGNSRFVITQDTLNYHIYLFENGNRVFSVKKQNDFLISPGGSYVAQIKDDSLTITDISTRQVLYSKHHKNITQYQFFPKSDKFLFFQEDSLLILDLPGQKEPVKIFGPTDLIKKIDVSPDETAILITCEKVVASLKLENVLKKSSLGMEKEIDTDVTPFFNVIIPEPKVAEKITFPNQYLHNPVEKIFSDIIKNSGKYPVFIDSIHVESKNSCFNLVSSPGGFPVKAMDQSGVELRFTPQKTGLNKGELIIVSGNKKYICQLEGKGIKEGFEHLSSQVNFPALNVYSSTDTIVPLIKNTGTEPISIAGMRVNSPYKGNFSVTPISPNRSLSPNDTLWVNLSFTPERRGRQNGIVQFRTDDGDWLTSSYLYGEGVAKRKVIIAGNTIHGLKKQPLPSIITITELNSANIVHQMHTDDLGSFAIETNTDLNYSINANLDGYFSSSENINLTTVKTRDTIWVNLELFPMNHSSTIRLNNIFFESGKSELLDISRVELLRIVTFLKNRKDLKVEIHGHTDNIGTSESNKSLSKLRAIAVKKFIVRHNITDERISVKYFGESKPIGNNNTEAGRKENRRVEIMFVQ
ncbi:MAG: OmpA family protein [Bacteroidota bacterium]